MLEPTSEGMTWCKSTYSGSGEHCVELGHTARTHAIRDTKLAAASPVIHTSADTFAALLTHMRRH